MKKPSCRGGLLFLACAFLLGETDRAPPTLAEWKNIPEQYQKWAAGTMTTVTGGIVQESP